VQEPEKGKLAVSALSPFKVYFEGQAEIVSAANRITNGFMSVHGDQVELFVNI
jgi:hypothetical protein